MKYVPHLLSIAMLGTSIIPPAMAQNTQYTDVPSGAYYEDAASALLEIGALDDNETRLRPSDLATRAELVKLLVNLTGKTLLYPSVSSFNDVPKGTWYAPYFEAAAVAGWVHGDNNCYQSSRPCTARPADRVNRAEAAALLGRAFSLEHTGVAPTFADNAQNQWYYVPIQTAADHCILQGDGGTGTVRPAALMNRAEMVVMFHRATLNMEYGVECGTPISSNGIDDITVQSSTQLRVTFTSDMQTVRAEDETRYTLVEVGNGDEIGTRLATKTSNRMVTLDLNGSLKSNTAYLLTTHSLADVKGEIFSDSMRFTTADSLSHNVTADLLSSGNVRLTFDTDLNRTRAEEKSRYTVERVSGGQSVPVLSATFLSNRIVELRLDGPLTPGIAYRITANGLLTSHSDLFTASATVTGVASTAGSITTVTALSPTRIRVVYNTGVDVIRSEETSRYTVMSGSGQITVGSVNQTSTDTVELTLDQSLSTQKLYTVSVNGMLTTQNNLFNDASSFLYSTGDISFSTTLTGDKEVPAVTTTMTGTGTFLLTSNGLRYDITVATMASGATITAAHFHRGSAGVSGPVVKEITFTGKRAVGTWTDLTAQQRNDLLNGLIYANIHTAANPNGEIRGQLTH